MKNNQIEQEIIPYNGNGSDVVTTDKKAPESGPYGIELIKRLIIEQFGRLPGKIFVIYDAGSTLKSVMKKDYERLIHDMLNDPLFRVINEGFGFRNLNISELLEIIKECKEDVLAH